VIGKGAKTVDCGDQKTLVGRQPLELAVPTTGPDDGDQISRLHLLIDETFEHLVDSREALFAKAQIIDDDGDSAIHLPRQDARWGNGRRGHTLPVDRQSESGDSPCALLNERKIGNPLRLTAFEDLEFLWLQI
jgi:hypothetical protein